MTTRPALACVATILLGAIGSCCLPGTSTTPTLLSDDRPAPPEIRRACAMAETKCTRCHSLDRVLVARITTPSDWRFQVDRMRLMSASGISPAEGTEIVRCLAFRTGPP